MAWWDSLKTLYNTPNWKPVRSHGPVLRGVHVGAYRPSGLVVISTDPGEASDMVALPEFQVQARCLHRRHLREELQPVGILAELLFDWMWSSFLRCLLIARTEAKVLTSDGPPMSLSFYPQPSKTTGI
jgi:hypothetical protein